MTLVSTAARSSGSSSAGALTLITTQTLLVDAATIDFSSIVQTYNDLRLVCYLVSGNAGASDSVYCRVNGDSGNNYHGTSLSSNGAAVSPLDTTGTNGVYVGECQAQGGWGALAPSPIYIDAPSYHAGTFQDLLWVAGVQTGGTAAANSGQYRAGSGVFGVGAATTQLTLRLPSGSSFKTGSSVRLYGIL